MTVLDAGNRTPDIPRDHNGWPLVPDPDQPDKTLRCMRPSGLAKKFLADTYTLKQWELRTVAKGAGLRPDLGQMAAALDIREDRDNLNSLAQQMSIAGGRETAANTGTAIHTVLEKLLNGEPCDIAPDLADTIDAIRRCLAENDVKAVPGWVEAFVICPQVPAAGSPDAYVTTNKTGSRPVTFDLKTSQHDPRGYNTPIEHAAQLSCYSHATHAWAGPGQPLRPILDNLNPDLGVILWAPAGSSHAELIGIDLKAGWQYVRLALDVKEIRTRNVAQETVITLPVEDEPPPAEPGTIHGRVGTLRQRIIRLIERTDCDKDTVLSSWPSGAPPLRPEQVAEHDAGTLDAITRMIGLLETRFGLYEATELGRAAHSARTSRLPADLGHQYVTAAAALDPPIQTGTVLQSDLDRLAPILAALEDEASDRRDGTRIILNRWTAADATGILVAACEPRHPTEYEDLPGYDDQAATATIDSLTALETERVAALAAYYYEHGGHTPDSATANLKAAYGNKAKALAAARIHQKRHGYPPIRSMDDITRNPVLTALAWHTPDPPPIAA